MLDFSVTVIPYQYGFNIRTAGLVLMIVGAVGVVMSMAALVMGGGWHRHRTVVDDGPGHVVRRADTYIWVLPSTPDLLAAFRRTKVRAETSGVGDSNVVA